MANKLSLVLLSLWLFACSDDSETPNRESVDDDPIVTSELRPAVPDRSIGRSEFRALKDQLEESPERVLTRADDNSGPTFDTEEQATAAFLQAIHNGDETSADNMLAAADSNWRVGLISQAQLAASDARRAKDYTLSYRIRRYAHIDLLKLWYLDAGVIRGRVVDAKSGQPIVGASVKSQLDPNGGTHSQQDGNFEIRVRPNIQAGLIIEHADYESRYGALPDRGVLTLAAHERVEVELSLTPKAPPVPEGARVTVAGQIVDIDSQQPITAMEIVAVPSSSGPEVLLTGAFHDITDNDGRFELHDVPLGSLSLIAQKASPIYMHQEELVVTTADNAYRLEAEQLHAKKVRIPMVVVGYVRDRATGQPITKAKVSGGTYRSIFTDSDGKFLLELTTGETWNVQASHKEYHPSATQSFNSPRPKKFETEYLLDPITTGTIIGVAIDSITGQPIVSATIQIAGQTVTTDRSGRFRIEEIEAGDVEISAGQDGYHADAQTISLAALSTAESRLVLEPITHGSIAGTVVDATSEQALAGVRLSVAGQYVESDANGAFLIENIEQGDVDVSATKPIYERAEMSTQVIAQETASLRILLTPITYGTLTGRVTDATTGQPLVNASVSVGALKFTTNAAGEFTAERAPAGDLIVRASLKRFYDGNRAITLEPAGSVNISLSLEPITTGTVRGIVRDATSGAPIGGATIVIAKLRTTTDVNGAFTIEDVAAGDIAVDANAKLFESGSKDIALLAATEAVVNIELVPVTYGNIAGNVLDITTKRPIEGARISIGDQTVISDANGAYSFDRVTAGTLTITSRKPVYRDDSTIINLAAGDSIKQQIELQEITTGSLRGTVRNKVNGQPLAGARVSVGRLSVTSDSTGAFVLENVPAGSVTLGAALTLYEPADKALTLAAAAEQTADLELLPITYGTVTGTVIDATSKNFIAGATVRVGDRKTVTDGKGHYKLQRISAGSVTVAAARPIYVDALQRRELSAGESLRVDLALEPITWGALSGQVVDDDNSAPLANAHVAVAGQTVVSDAKGRFSIEKIAAGSLTISATKDAYKSGALRLDLAPDGTAEGIVRLEPIKIGTVHGQVLDAKTGEAIAQARITTAGKSAESDASGRFSFDNVAIGRVVVAAQHADYANGSSTALLAGGQNIDVVIKLDLRREDVTNLEAALAAEGSIDLYGIYFDSGKDRFKPSSINTLRAVLEVMKRAPQRHFQIAGHTDSDGADATNQNLSERRAATVIAWLVQNGIAPSRLSALGYGETRPAAPNDTTSGKALNRRVQLSFTN